MKIPFQARFAIGILLAVLLAAALAPWLFPGDPQDMSLTPYLWPGQDWRGGWGTAVRSPAGSGTPSRASISAYRRRASSALAGVERRASNSLMSAPALKAWSPAPVMTTTRTPGSSRSAWA